MWCSTYTKATHWHLLHHGSFVSGFCYYLEEEGLLDYHSRRSCSGYFGFIRTEAVIVCQQPAVNTNVPPSWNVNLSLQMIPVPLWNCSQTFEWAVSCRSFAVCSLLFSFRTPLPLITNPFLFRQGIWIAVISKCFGNTKLCHCGRECKEMLWHLCVPGQKKDLMQTFIGFTPFYVIIEEHTCGVLYTNVLRN